MFGFPLLPPEFEPEATNKVGVPLETEAVKKLATSTSAYDETSLPNPSDQLLLIGYKINLKLVGIGFPAITSNIFNLQLKEEWAMSNIDPVNALRESKSNAINALDNSINPVVLPDIVLSSNNLKR